MMMLVNDRGIGIELWPERKKHVLTVIDGPNHMKVGTFSNEESAVKFAEAMQTLFEDLQVPEVKENDDK